MNHSSMSNTQNPKPNTSRTEQGNVFLIILIAVALFAALAFTVSRGFQSSTTNTLSDREAALAATNIISYAQNIERGISRLRRKGISENDISFNQSVVSGYNHTAPQPDSHKVFHTSGGAVNWKSPESGVNDGSDWSFIGTTCIADIGGGATGCDSDDESNEELLAVLSNVVDVVCTELNDRLNITNIPADTGGGASTTKFKGSFVDGTEIILSGGPYNAACFSYGGANYFYYVLLER